VQAIAMSSYIYVSASWAFSLMVFGATLFIRKVVSVVSCAACFAGLALTTLVATVIMQARTGAKLTRPRGGGTPYHHGTRGM